MGKTGFSILVMMICFVLIENYSLCQNGATAESSKIERVTKKGGWPIPSITDCRLRKTATVRDLIPNVETTKKLYILISPIPMLLEFYFFNNVTGTLSIVPRNCLLTSFYSYEYNAKIICYELQFSPVDSNGQPVFGTFTFYAIDEDGDGVFETRIDRRTKVELPKWISSPKP